MGHPVLAVGYRVLIVQSFDKRKDEQFRWGEKIMPAFIGYIVLGGEMW